MEGLKIPLLIKQKKQNEQTEKKKMLEKKAIGRFKAYHGTKENRRISPCNQFEETELSR